MLASVSTSLLNVRSLPSLRGHILGTYQQGDVVVFDAAEPGWVKVDYGNSIGFIAERFIEPVANIRSIKGRVTASALNVRAQPMIGSQSIGTVAHDTELVVLSFLNDWLEIEFNGDIGYVFSQYVTLNYYQPNSNVLPYEVKVQWLNVRRSPSIQSSILGQLSFGAKVNVMADLGQWKSFQFNGVTGFVASQFLHELEDDGGSQEVRLHSEHVEESDATGTSTIISTPSQRSSHLLPVTGNSTERKVASTWNRFNSILTTLSEKKSLDAACAVAVICVESSGKGFEQNNQNRMIIRFENHKFWTYWGKSHSDIFRQHFKSDDEKIWRGHQFRQSTEDDWTSFHGSQKKEWDVFEFARQLNERAAMLSISMGASQIMGFNYETVGYLSVQDMFDTFSKSIDAHLEGLFDFCTPTMLENLRQLEFEDFAARYNGSGQKRKYGLLIQQHYQTFKKIMKTRGQ